MIPLTVSCVRHDGLVSSDRFDGLDMASLNASEAKQNDQRNVSFML